MATTEHRRLAAVCNEVDAATSLVRHGLRVLEGYRFAAHDAESVFALLAGGAEKVLKLSIGHHGVATRGVWESTFEESHHIVRLDERTRQIIRDGVSSGAVIPFVGTLLDAVDQDVFIDQVLGTLERYAFRGRYYNLDHLRDRPQPEDSPARMWEDLHHAIFDQRPELLEEIGIGDWEAGRSSLNAEIAASVRGWYEMIQRAWLCGAFGSEATCWAPQLGLTSKRPSHPFAADYVLVAS